MQTINAGEIFSGECPSGSNAGLFVGDKLPSPEKAFVKVLRVEGTRFDLGPLKAGEISVNVPCGESFENISFLVKEMSPEAAMNRYSPLGSEKVEYPLALYVIIAVLLLSPLLGLWGYKLRKKKVLEKKVSAAKIKKSSRELLERDLAFLESNITHPESHHFHQLYKRLRKFIEKELNLKTRGHTTQEFLGTFRALALQQSSNQALISQLEYLLLTADDVRFAGKAFTAELWKDYLQKSRAIIKAFPSKAQEPKKK